MHLAIPAVISTHLLSIYYVLGTLSDVTGVVVEVPEQIIRGASHSRTPPFIKHRVLPWCQVRCQIRK